MSSLYELTDEYKVVEDILYDPEVDEQTVIDTLEAISGGGIEDKAGNYAKLIRELKADADKLAHDGPGGTADGC